MKLRITISSLCLLLAGLTTSGCDSQSADDSTPPALIPPEAFSVQTEVFAPAANKALAKLNFAAAALRVWPVSAILHAHLLIPAAVTGAALQDTPELVDGVWIWSTSTAVASHPVTFTLTGDPAADGVHWSLHISSEEPLDGADFDGFELFTAHASPGGLTGTWQLYYPIDGERRNVLNAEYVLTSDDEKEITFSIPHGAQENAGDRVRYAAGGSARTFDWHQEGASLDHAVTWDQDSKAGSIVATNYNGGAAGCWDAQLEDVACAD